MVVGELFGSTFDFVIGQSEEIAKPCSDGPLKAAGSAGQNQRNVFISECQNGYANRKRGGNAHGGRSLGLQDEQELQENGARGYNENPKELLRIYEEYNND